MIDNKEDYIKNAEGKIQSVEDLLIDYKEGYIKVAEGEVEAVEALLALICQAGVAGRWQPQQVVRVALCLTTRVIFACVQPSAYQAIIDSMRDLLVDEDVIAQLSDNELSDTDVATNQTNATESL